MSAPNDRLDYRQCIYTVTAKKMHKPPVRELTEMLTLVNIDTAKKELKARYLSKYGWQLSPAQVARSYRRIDDDLSPDEVVNYFYDPIAAKKYFDNILTIGNKFF